MKRLLLVLVMFFMLAGCETIKETPQGTTRDDLVEDPVDDPVDEPITYVFESTVTDKIVVYEGTTVDLEDYVVVTKDDVELDFDINWIEGTYDLSVPGTYNLSVVYENEAEGADIDVSFILVVVEVYTFDLETGTLTHEYGDTPVWNDYFTVLDNSSNDVTINSSWVSCGNFETLGTVSCDVTYEKEGLDVLDESFSITVVDTTAPVLTVIDDISFDFIGGMPVIEDYITAIDNYDGDVIDSLEYDLTAIDFTSIGSYTLSLTITDSSGNSTTEDITLDLLAEEILGLSLDEITMLAGLASMFTVVPEPIVVGEIGTINQDILGIDSLIGTRSMTDEEIIYSIDFNSVTSPEYVEIVNTYNGSLSTVNSYLGVILPLLTTMTEFDHTYTLGGFDFMITKVDESQYQITAIGTIYEQPITIEIIIDEMSILGEFMYSIEFTTPIASWHYEIVRDLLEIKSIFEIIEFMGDSYGIVYMNGFILEDGNISGFIFKDEINLTRRMYFEFTDDYKSIYYLNDDTGTEKYISLDENEELVFEYENYMPNIPLVGSSKVRWSLDKFSGITSIEFEDGFFSNNYIVNSTDIGESDTFKIESKNYVIVVYDDVNLVYVEETAPNWFLRIEGDFTDDFADLFAFESIMTPTYTYDVEQAMTDLDANKELITVFDISVMTITKAEILAELDN